MSPKITVHGGATNAREAASSPDAVASKPLAGAEAGQGRPTAEAVVLPVQEAEVVEVVPEVPSDVPAAEDAAPLPEPEPVIDPYAGKTLAELRDAADARGVASYGSKAQIAERLRAADAR
jgi:hypothetical protein